MVYTIDSEILKEILKIRAKATTGRILKRLEINLPIEQIKAEIKELVPEEYRMLEEILSSINKSESVYILRQKNS